MNQIKLKYSPLLTLEVEQLFYQNKVCKKYKTIPLSDFEIVPTKECRSLMTKLDLVFKNTAYSGGFVILARLREGSIAGNDVLQFSPKNEDKLTFLLKIKNADVLNFNDLDISSLEDKVFYFTNQQNYPTALRNNLPLSIDSSGVTGGNDLLKISRQLYRYYHPSPLASGSAVIKHLLSGLAVFPRSIQARNGGVDLFFDLGQLSSGKCQLIIEGVVGEQFYYLGKMDERSPFGIIELSLSPTLNPNYRIVESDKSLTADRPNYKIRFINRATHWRYTMHLEANSPLYLELAALSPGDKVDFLNRLNIITNDSTISFNQVRVTDTDLIFVSNSALTLQEQYVSSTSTNNDVLSLALKKYIGNPAQEAEVKGNLPYPPTTVLDASSLPTIYSDIFITL